MTVENSSPESEQFSETRDSWDRLVEELSVDQQPEQAADQSETTANSLGQTEADAAAGAEPEGSNLESESEHALIDYVKTLGYQGEDFKTDQDVLARLQKLVEPAKPSTDSETQATLERYSRELNELRSQLEKNSSVGVNPQTVAHELSPQMPADKQVAVKKIPSLSDESLRLKQSGLIKQDPATGLFVATANEYSTFARELNDRAQWERERSRRVIEDPMSVLMEEGLKDLFEKQ